MSREMAALGLHAEAASALLLHAKLLRCDSPSAAASPPEGAAAAAEQGQQQAGCGPTGNAATGSYLPDSVSVADHLNATIEVQTGCHGDCKGPGAHTLLEEAEMGGGVTFPRQTALARREKLYEMCMDLLESAQQWEMAIELADALKRQFSTATFEFGKCSTLLKRCADWYASVVNVERFYPSVFRVAYYGLKYPPQIRNQEFIYRGAPLEQTIDFSGRVKNKFPGVVLLPLKTNIGPEHTDQAETYYIAISKLTPSTRPEARALPASTHVTEPLLPPGLRGYLQNNALDTFSYQRPYNMRKESGLKKSANSSVFFASLGKDKSLDTDGEFRDLWVEFKYVRAGRMFPSWARRVLVTETASVFRNPIEMAIETMQGKNNEVEAKVALMENLPDGGADQSYTMALNGVVDAAVNGGLANYVSFLNGDYRTLNPEIAEDIDKHPLKKEDTAELARLVKQQIELMDHGIKIHSSKVCEAMKPLGAYMEENYQKMRKDALHWSAQAKAV
jgi:hypothetical protein